MFRPFRPFHVENTILKNFHCIDILWAKKQGYYEL